MSKQLYKIGEELNIRVNSLPNDYIVKGKVTKAWFVDEDDSEYEGFLGDNHQYHYMLVTENQKTYARSESDLKITLGNRR